MNGEDLWITLVEEGTAVVMAVEGEVDIVTSVRLNRELQALLDREPPPAAIRVDLSDAPFMDTTGLAVLLAARRRAAEQDVDFAVRSPSRAISRVLNVTGLEDLLLESR